MSDDPIRRAIHELVASAPDPRPLPERGPAPLPGPRSYRWVAVAASAVLIVAGAVAIAAWPSGDSDAPVSSDSTVTVTTTPPPSSTAIPTTTAVTTPSTTVEPATTLTESSTDDVDPVPRTTEPSGPVDRYPLNVPEGSLTVTADDLLVTHVDGDLYWYPSVLSAEPAEPVLLVDMADPRVEPEEGPGPNVVDAAGGVVNGSLVYATCCEPVSGNILTLGSPRGESLPLAPGYWPTLSPDGTRLATINLYSFEVWDLAVGERASRAIDVDPQLSNAQQLIWSADGASLFTLRFDEAGWELVRVSAEPPFDVTGVTALPDIGSPINSADTASLVGVDGDGNVVVHVQFEDRDRLESFDPVSLERVNGPWSREGDHADSRYVLSPDGTRLVSWSDAGVQLEQLGHVPVPILATGARGVWFVDEAAV